MRWIGHRLCRTIEHWLHRRELTLVVAVFASSRVLMAFLAAFPQAYTPTVLPVTSDLFLYFRWAHEILGGSTPYADIAIEYPPGTLPFIVWPAVAKAAVGIPYRMGFIGTMVAVDAIVLSRLTHLSRRRGTWLGVWLWVLGLPLLGPLCWLRLDLVPAAATVVALECFVGHRSAAGGACLGLGAAVKVYPAFLLPSVLTLAGHPGRQLAAAAAAGALFVLPLAGVMPAAIANVAFYHAQRGIQLDSTWSNVLLLSAFLGHHVAIDYGYGAIEVTSSAAPVLKQISNLLSVCVVVASCWVAHRWLPRNDGGDISGLWFAVLAWLLLTGSVLSPQFLIWLLALGAGACACGAARRSAAVVLLLSLALTQVLYPFLYTRLAWMRADAVFVLTLRNGLLGVLGVLAAGEVWAKSARTLSACGSTDSMGLTGPANTEMQPGRQRRGGV